MLFRRAAKLSGILFFLSLHAARVLPAAGQVPTPLELNYHLRLSHPSMHLVEVRIDVTHVTSPNIDFVLPAWSSGRYAIYNFAKNVKEFEVSDGSGRPLPWTQPDKQTWRVDTQNSAGTVRARYRVYANDLNGSFSQFDSSHLNLNGASVYMYVDGHKQDPLTLTVDELPAMTPSWKIVSGFSPSTGQKSFAVASY